ncbi:hypothetical protein JOQ06_009138 [Pogonophryne albipinna]|uniref:L1 transposable element RRM domain-containing protein n=1 Tax=Pogonophryne albipinna TaxID=1090488 RepID=A0AAD6BPX9_9TELE|nr:hypothetical protein JOQ06_009138 [Pogonophryne albipinna]
MPPKPLKAVQASNGEAKATSKSSVDASMLQAFREIVKEVIQEENNGLREEIKRTISPLKIALDECHDKLRAHEEGLNSFDARLQAMETRYANLNSDYKKLQEKTDDLENRGRRCNLRIIGVPEGSSRGGQTRPFILRVHYFQEKERIQRLARQKGRLEFQGKQILIFPDYSADLSRRRAAFSEVKELLRKEEGVRYGLLYPARLRISFNGQTKMFENPQAAKDFVMAKFRPA